MTPPVENTVHVTSRPFVDIDTGAFGMLVLGALMLAVTLMSVFVLSHQSLRLDEAQSLWQTSHSLPRVMSIVAGDVHVPFYHIILHFWQTAFGNSVIAARMLSLLFFVLTIPAVYALGYLAYGRRSIALFAALLVALSPFLNWYGNEIRMYSLLTLLTVLNQYFFIRLYKSGRPSAGVWWGYALTAWFGLMTHYFFGLGLLAQAIFFLVNRKIFAPRTFTKLALVAVVLMVTLGSWFGYVRSVGNAENSTPQLTEPTAVNLFNTFSQFMFGFQEDSINTVIVSLWPLAVLLAFLLLREDRRLAPHTVYFFLAAILPVLVVFLASITIHPLYVSRYMILTIPSLYLFLAWILSTYSPRLSNAFKTILIIVMMVTFFHQTVSASTPVKEDFRGVAQYLMEHGSPQDVIAVSAPFTVYPIEYYYRGPAAIETLPIWDRFKVGGMPAFSEAGLPQDVATIKGRHHVMWLVLSYDQGYQKNIELYMDTNFERLEEKQFSPGLTLRAYKLRYDVGN
jgi:mannosyltransferase